MRRYPYFAPEGILLLLAALSLVVPLVSPGMYNYGMALLSLVLFVAIFRAFDGYARDFDSSVKGIKGLASWDTRFFSLGTLEIRYGGEKARYRSETRPAGKTIPVDYFLDFENGSDESFVIARRAEGGFATVDGAGFLKAAGAEIKAFDECYSVREISNSDGVLEICVRLEFEKGPAPSKEEKLADMSGFLEDFLSFGSGLNGLLKKRKGGKRKPDN